MREEAKAAQAAAAAGGGAANFQTMPHGPPPPTQPLPTQQQINNSSMAPTTPRHMSQTMNPRRSMANPGNPNQQQALYDQPNCDYEPPKNFQNFGNPYDCPEGMYGGSMVSSGVGYSQVSDYSQQPMLLPGQQIALQQQQQQQLQQQMQKQ